MSESIQQFYSGKHPLLGIYHAASEPKLRPDNSIAMLMVVGGAQYRVGSHRLYRKLARFMASAGYPVLRFDCRGMGDSAGKWLGFEHIHDDIAAALRQLKSLQPNLREVLLWGLCDGASAAILNAQHWPEVKGLILVNPWLNSERSEARSMMRHYYLRRLFSADLWRKIFSGAFSLTASWRSFSGYARQLKRSHSAEDDSLETRMRRGLLDYEGKISLILAANDLTAQAFMDWFSSQKQQYTELSSIPVDIVAGADHTFSDAVHCEQLMQATLAAAKRCSA